jgi:hypothetical protein
MSDSHSFIGGPGDERQAALFKGIGCSLAVGSGKSALTMGASSPFYSTIGILIGSSFVFKKKGLLQSTERAGIYTTDAIVQALTHFSLGGVAGEGYHYLRSVMWWAGMILSKCKRHLIPSLKIVLFGSDAR